MEQEPDIRQALLDPGSVFDSPEAVLHASTLTQSQKIEILRPWAYDARELAVAEEEGMILDQPSLLHRVLLALEQLGANLDLEHTSPTKQDGA